jgi:hypothetical protein
VKTGFVYIWYDRKHKRYYIGSHWGSEDDGYICSSRWMRNAYRRRGKDFKRRIIARVTSSRGDLLAEEHRWLQMIQAVDLGGKYYNLTNHLNGHWTTDESKSLTIKQKLSAAQKRNFEDPAYRERYMETRQHLPAQSEETREKRRQAMLGKNVGRKKTEAFYEARKKLRGRPTSDKQKQRTREVGNFKKLNSTKVTCIHCGKEGNVGNIARYHNDRCKQRFVSKQ